jgi:DNA-3-methyladenine glycosylase II
MSSSISNPSVYAEAIQFLSNIDADWAHLINTVGACTIALETEPNLSPYEALVQAVAYQQLHAKAGDAIFARFKNLFDQDGKNEFPQPQQLLAANFDDLRACGFSGRKIETIQGIAQATINGIVPNRKEAEAMSNEALIERLITLKGIGRWTVEMMLIFTFERMDILAVDDLAIVAGYARLKKLVAPPKPKQMAEIGKAWAPYRTVASWYLWRMPRLENRPRTPKASA